jgi:hypothetical protein
MQNPTAPPGGKIGGKTSQTTQGAAILAPMNTTAAKSAGGLMARAERLLPVQNPTALSGKDIQ